MREQTATVAALAGLLLSGCSTEQALRDRWQSVYQERCRDRAWVVNCVDLRVKYNAAALRAWKREALDARARGQMADADPAFAAGMAAIDYAIASTWDDRPNFLSRGFMGGSRTWSEPMLRNELLTNDAIAALYHDASGRQGVGPR